MKILYVQPGPGMGGSKISLYHMVKCASSSQKSFLALSAPVQTDYEGLIKPFVEKIFYQEIPTWQKYHRQTWFEKLRAPFGNTYRIMSSIPAAIKLAKIIKAENIDLVHTNNSITLVGALAAWITNTPHVWHVREAFGSKRQYRPIVSDALTYWLMKHLSDVIICNSAYTAEPFRERQIKHIIIQNGIDLTEFTVDDTQGASIRSQYAIKRDEIVIGMVGNLSTELKRHNIFLDMAQVLIKEHHQLKFIIFGGSSNLDQTDYTRSLAQQVNNSGLSDKVIWAEFIEDTPAMMNSVDILVHPALTEGSGRVIMEAMAAGKPVVGMKSGGVQELIRDGENGFLIQPGNDQDLAVKVKLLLEDENLRQNIAANARIYAHSNFSNQANMRAIEDVYQNLVREQAKINE
jgi:glycosyltransferase involved in cell wall biosynthesis